MTVIRAQRSWLDFGLSELWGYRDLVATLVWRDFVANYKQTVLGLFWNFLQPLLTTLVVTLVFAGIVRMPTSGTSPFLFYFSGVVIWGYFANCVNRTANTLIANAPLFSKVYFPRLAVPVASVLSALVGFSIQFALLVVFVVNSGSIDSRDKLLTSLFLTPLLVGMMAIFGLGLGTLVSGLTTRYRDLQHLLAFGVQLWMYLTPVLYPLEIVPERYRWLVALNPLTHAVDGFRVAILGVGTVHLNGLIYGFVSMVLLLLTGLVVFRRAEATFVDTI